MGSDIVATHESPRENFSVAIMRCGFAVACGTITKVPIVIGQLCGPGLSVSISSKLAFTFELLLFKADANPSPVGATNFPSRFLNFTYANLSCTT